MDQALATVADMFLDRYGEDPLLVRSPGRINVIGEHTDYNDGFVLPAAIDLEVRLALRPNGTTGLCRMYAVDLDQTAELELDDLAPRAKPGWVNYLLGVAGIMRKQGHELAGVDVVFSSTIPTGAGLSSSAAIENGMAVALNEAFSLGIDRERLARMAQQAEHHYAGVLCGIMDQFASMMGRPGEALLLDCRTLDYAHIPMALGDYHWVLCDSGVKHALADSAYNTRREECEEAVNRLRMAYPEIQALRDVSKDMLEAEGDLLAPEILQRARHVVTENQRCQMAGASLKAGDLEDLGDLLYDSHQSLQYDYEVSCQELDTLVDLTRPWPEVPGARMMGGGFGGCTLNVVHDDFRADFETYMQRGFQDAFQRPLRMYPVRIVAGTSPAS